MLDEKEKERRWYPLKSSQGNILSIREHLKKLRMIEIFLPVTKEPVVLTDGDIVIKETPWFDDIIFVRHSKSYIEELMHKDKLCSQLSFMIKKDDNGNPDIVTIDDRVMQLFIYALEVMKEHVTLLKMSDNLRRMGKRCRILGGKLAGMHLGRQARRHGRSVAPRTKHPPCLYRPQRHHHRPDRLHAKKLHRDIGVRNGYY